MMPPLLYRCSECGHVSLSVRFQVVEDGPRAVECPECGHRFEPIDNPLLN